MALNDAEIEYMEAHINDSKVSSIWISSSLCIAAATIAVILRFIARRSTGNGLGKDDYSIFVGYVSSSLLL